MWTNYIYLTAMWTNPNIHSHVARELRENHVPNSSAPWHRVTVWVVMLIDLIFFSIFFILIEAIVWWRKGWGRGGEGGNQCIWRNPLDNGLQIMSHTETYPRCCRDSSSPSSVGQTVLPGNTAYYTMCWQYVDCCTVLQHLRMSFVCTLSNIKNHWIVQHLRMSFVCTFIQYQKPLDRPTFEDVICMYLIQYQKPLDRPTFEDVICMYLIQYQKPLDRPTFEDVICMYLIQYQKPLDRPTFEDVICMYLIQYQKPLDRPTFEDVICMYLIQYQKPLDRANIMHYSTACSKNRSFELVFF